MAEPIGLTLSVLGLAGLFSVCTDCFDYIQDLRELGKDYVILDTQFSALRWRLCNWGNSVGLIKPESEQGAILRNPLLQQQIREQLNVISLFFLDSAKVIKKYELKERYEFQANRLTGDNAAVIEEGLQDFLQRITATRRRAGLVKATVWALKDKRNFKRLIHNLEKAIGQLERIEEKMIRARPQPSLCKVIENIKPSDPDGVELPQQEFHTGHQKGEDELSSTSSDGIFPTQDRKCSAVGRTITFNFAFNFNTQAADVHIIRNTQIQDGSASLKSKAQSVSEEELNTIMALVAIYLWICRLLAFFVVGVYTLWSISPSVSTMLPDNIILYDALGREYSLDLNMFSDWSVVTSMLKSKFTNCPGYQKVLSGQFSITCVRNLEQSIGSWNWSEVVTKRRKFKMSILMLRLTMKDGFCINCKIYVQAISESTFACSKCGLFYQDLSRGKQVDLGLKDLETAQKPFLPIEPEEFVPLSDPPFYNAFYRSWNLIQGIKGMIIEAEVSGEDGAALNIMKKARKPRKRPENEVEIGSGISDVNQIEELEQSKIAQEQLAREKTDIRFLKSVSIQQTASLHDAALYGRIRSVRNLLENGVQPDKQPGHWGTPLTAAIFGRSDKVVRILLKANSNILSQAGPLRGPIQAAARRGSLLSFNKVIAQTMRVREQSRRVAEAFQNAVDHALLLMVEDDDDSIVSEKRICLLLYAGANPFQRLRNGITAFARAIASDKPRLSAFFLAEAWDRALLDDESMLALVAIVFGREVTTLSLSDWVRACCRDIQSGGAKLLEQYITEMLKGKLFWEQEMGGALTQIVDSAFNEEYGDHTEDSCDDDDWDGASYFTDDDEVDDDNDIDENNDELY
jgi:Prion-inhibition and propagation